MPATPYELFGNVATAIVTSGGQTALTSDNSFTVAALGTFPSVSNTASPPTQFRFADPEAPSEMMTATNVSGGGTTWAVTRGAEGTTPVAHAPNWTAREVTTGGVLQAFQDLLTWGFQPYYQTGTFTPSATKGSYGTTLTIAPPSGYRSFVPLHVYVQGISLAANESLTVLGAGTLEDGTSGGSTITLSVTTAGSTGGVVDSALLMAGFAAASNLTPGQTVWWGGNPATGKRLASYAFNVKSTTNTSSGASVNYAWWAMLIL